MKRRQRTRRLAVALSVLAVAVLLVVVAYLAAFSGGGSQLDSKVNQPVSSSDMAGLQTASLQPFGQAPPTTMLSALHSYSGNPWTSGGKPIVLYVGAEFCMYCALQRWALVVALSRFGELSGLEYMTSGSNEGDLPTFTFVGSSYSSSYVAFRPYELEDRSNPPHSLQALPSNYSAAWTQYGGKGYPFIDFGNAYYVSGSLISDTSVLQGNWTTIIRSVVAADAKGTQVRQAANLITAAICKVTQGSPSSVCGASPIDSTTTGIAAPLAGILSPQSFAYQAALQDRVIQRGPGAEVPL